jgi:hypothetical protein
MTLTQPEIRFLTALAREQNQTGCRGPAHELLRKHIYPDAPRAGPGSLAFSYESVPLTALLVEDLGDLQAIDDFLRQGERIAEPVWPWPCPHSYRTRLEEARNVWITRKESLAATFNGTDGRQATQPAPPTGKAG